MLKLIGTENGEVVDEKVILDDDNKPTGFFLKLLICGLLLDVTVFTLVGTLIRICRACGKKDQ